MLVRNGLACRACGDQCVESISESNPVKIECPICDGTKCAECTDGFFDLICCARHYADNELVEAINMTALVDKGFWPVAGGILDQANYFVNLYQFVTSEQSRIDEERIKNR